jgi:3'-phosphoadenosine 5'-phosphosulfate sulfotransferase (PAPS reductase)/FAD synthetase
VNVEELRILQTMPTTFKIRWAKEKIHEWYEHWDGKVYVAFSGGKDSTVLLHIVRQLYPEVPAVFVDTGLEFPEVREFVKTIENVEWLKPKTPFIEVIDKYGYPVVSKQVAMAISRYRNTKSDVQRQLRLHGGINPSTGKKQTTGVIPKKYHYLIDAPFKIGEGCCDAMKKRPFEQYNKESDRKPFVGVMVDDSHGRLNSYIKFGCNAFTSKKPMSRPLSIWTSEDIWTCLKAGIKYSSIYDKGYDRTGCMFCMFGCQMEKESRFKRLAKTHPKIHEYCMTQLGLQDVLTFMDLPYT